MGTLTVEYPGGYYDSELGLVCTRYATEGRMAMVWALFKNGTRAGEPFKMIIPNAMSAEVKAKLKKCYQFKEWCNEVHNQTVE